MRDAASRSEAGRTGARARWGSSKLDRLADELAARTADLSPDRVALLLAALRDEAEDEGDE